MGFASKYRNELGLLIAIACVIGFTLLFNQAYLTSPALNAKTILHQAALLGIFALGAAIVIIVGGIDLSSGSVIVFSASICGLVLSARSVPCAVRSRLAHGLGHPFSRIILLRMETKTNRAGLFWGTSGVRL